MGWEKRRPSVLVAADDAPDLLRLHLGMVEVAAGGATGQWWSRDTGVRKMEASGAVGDGDRRGTGGRGDMEADERGDGDLEVAGGRRRRELR
jgi:hypothetical protein